MTTIAWLLPDVQPAIGDDCDIDGMRYRVLDSTWLPQTPHPGLLVHDRGRAIQLELDPFGDSPEDPLLPRARAIIERHGGTVEQLGAQRQGTWRHASIHAKATRPGCTIDVYGSGENDHAALADFEDHVQSMMGHHKRRP